MANRLRWHPGQVVRPSFLSVLRVTKKELPSRLAQVSSLDKQSVSDPRPHRQGNSPHNGRRHDLGEKRIIEHAGKSSIYFEKQHPSGTSTFRPHFAYGNPPSGGFGGRGFFSLFRHFPAARGNPDRHVRLMGDQVVDFNEHELRREDLRDQKFKFLLTLRPCAGEKLGRPKVQFVPFPVIRTYHAEPIGLPCFGMRVCRTGRGWYLLVRSSSCKRSSCSSSRSPNALVLCPSTPPAPWLASTRSQAIFRFSGWYTLSISECTFFAPVGLSHSASPRTLMYGSFPRELFHLSALTHLSASQLPRPTLGRQSLGHVAFAALLVLPGRPTTRRAPRSLSRSLIGPLLPVPPGNSASSPGVTCWSSVPCRPQTPWCGGWMRTPSPL